MATDLKTRETSERLRSLIEEKYPARGRFTMLAEASGISAARWKNFYYRKQEAASDMVQFWCKSYPVDRTWLMTGVIPWSEQDFPFGAPAPEAREDQTVGDRLNWVISEWASPSGEHLFKYLEKKSAGMIPAGEWSKVVLRMQEPSIEMIRLVCSFRPQFTEWVLLGKVTDEPAVDPTNRASVEKWKQWRARDLDAIERAAAGEQLSD